MTVRCISPLAKVTGSRRKASNELLLDFASQLRAALAPSAHAMNASGSQTCDSLLGLVGTGPLAASGEIIAVEPAHMELAEPSIADAVGSLIDQGADAIVLSPFFLGNSVSLLEAAAILATFMR